MLIIFIVYKIMLTGEMGYEVSMPFPWDLNPINIWGGVLAR